MNDRKLALILTIIYFGLIVFIFSIKEVAGIIVFTFINVAILSAISNFLEKFLKKKLLCNVMALAVLFIVFGIALYLIIPAVIKEFSSFYGIITENLKNETWKEYIKNPRLLSLAETVINYIKPALEDFIKNSISKITGSIPDFSLQLFFIILGTVYSLIYFDHLRRFPEVIYPRRVWRFSDPFMRELFINLKRFVQAIFVTALMTGLLFFMVFEIMRLNYSVTIGVWAFITNFIPIVGVIFEYIPVFLFSLSLGLNGVIIMAGLTLVIHTIAFVTFLTMMKGYTKINPVEMLFFIILMWKFQGLLGIFIAVPLTIFISVFWKHYLKPMFEEE